MATETIQSRAPTRIDLAGGTLDIWPLFLFLKDPLTLNVGIDLYAEATLTSSSSAESIQLLAKDQGAELRFSWKDLETESISPPPALELHYKLLKYFYPQKKGSSGAFPMNLSLCTQARSPAGAGLGGSSSLSIALIGAIATWARGHNDTLKDGENFIETVRDIETTVIGVPAGLQDYYGAMYGGLQRLQWGTAKHQREWLPEFLLPELEKRVLLFYSGQSRNSGINNWALFKSFIDQNKSSGSSPDPFNNHPIRSKFEQISGATHHLETSLRNQDWLGVSEAIAKEWDIRKTLAEGITTPEIDAAFTEARRITPLSGKICGAGGGGCFFVYLPDPDSDPQLKSRIVEIFSKRNIRSLPFHCVRRGLEVHVTSS